MTFVGQMASRSYRMAVRETKDRLKGILAGPGSSLDWAGVEAEFDAHIAEEQRLEAEKKAAATKDVPQSSASKAPEAPNTAATPTSNEAEPEDILSGSSDGAGSTDSSPDKTHAA